MTDAEHELIAAYALDALDDPMDLRRVEELLASSPEARSELRALSDAASGLAAATSGPAPSPELRGRVLAAARAEPQNVVPLAPRRGRTGVVVAGALAAVAAAVALGLGLRVATLSDDLDRARSALATQEQTAAVLADPAAQTVALTTGEGRLVVAEQGTAVLVAQGLEPPREGSTYQLWIVEDETPTSAGLYPGTTRGQAVVPVAGTVAQGAVVAVTVEPDGGSPSPTGTIVLASQPAPA